MPIQNLSMPEETINSGEDIHAKLDALVLSYEEVVRDSELNGMPKLNFWARQYLSELRNHRRDIQKRWGKDMLVHLFDAFDEKLFRLGLQFYGDGFVHPFYLPPTKLL